jgi:hypothetical protein
MMFVSERERAREDGYKMGGRGRLESKRRDIERLASVVGACACVCVRVFSAPSMLRFVD